MKRTLSATAIAVALAATAAAQHGTGQKHAPKHGTSSKQGKHKTEQHKAEQHKSEQHKAGEHKDGHHAAAPAEQTADVNLAAGQILRRGEPLGNSETVKLADALADPQKFAGRTVIVEGSVERVCQKQGCWMELVPEKGTRGVRVTFNDHAFFIPFNSAGLRARAEGRFAVKTLSKEEADHLEADGAKVQRDSEGKATEVSFVATGLELKK